MCTINLFYKTLDLKITIQLVINTGHHINKNISHKMHVIWNSLPKDLRSFNHLKVFKKHLKTYYFKIAFEV